MKTPLHYPYVTFAYIIHGVEDYQFKTSEEVNNVLEFDIMSIQGMSKLSEEKKEFAERMIIRFLNAQGLESRDGMFPTSIVDALEERCLKMYYKHFKRKEWIHLRYSGGWD